MRLKHLLLSATLCLVVPFALNAQITFQNSNSLLNNNNQDFNSGVAIGVTDMNEDGYDDIVHMDEGNDLYLELQQPDGSFQTIYIGSMSNESQWTMCVADVDNNGFCDVVTGGSYDNIKIAMADISGTSYSITNLPDANLFAQGSNMADINNDGWLDVFVCHDDAESVIWGNDGTGNLVLSNDWIDMTTDPVSDNSGNYGSIWTDFDNDGDTDLYIAKCRQGVGNPADPRRINALFVNDGNGNYTEQAGDYGLKIGAQSWTADFNDIDNDGDMDCFITNHDVASMLLENDGTGHFTDITAGSGIDVNGTPIQGVMRDFDNDGYVDILVAGGAANLFMNNGDKTFTAVSTNFDDLDNMESYAIGDLNHDGFLDVYGGYANIYTNPSNTDDVLWINDGNDNNYLTVQLRGTDSNRNAVGAKVVIEGDFGIQVREVRSGESYGIMNSMILHFGLGDATTIDKLTISWPAGGVNVYENIDANQNLFYEEEGCDAPIVTIEANGPTVICLGETVEISAPAGYIYEWSDGSDGQSIVVSDPGNYYVLVSEDGSCFGQSNFIEVIVDPIEIPTLTIDGDTEFCLGGSVTLTSSEAISYTWSNGDEAQSTEITESGTYYVTIEGQCDDFESESVEVSVYEADEPTADDQVIAEPQVVTLIATGDNPQWYDAETAGNLLGIGNSYETGLIEETTTFYVEDLVNFDGGLFSVGQVTHTGGSQYAGSDNYNGTVEFDVEKTFVLQTVTVLTDLAGVRNFILLDANETVVASHEEDISIGQTVVELNWVIEAGSDYIMTTDESVNQSSFGFDGPRLMRSSGGVDYPYLVEDVLSINGSNGGEIYYYYFYNWQVLKVGTDCASDRIPVTVTLDPTINSTSDIIRLDGMDVFPNPAGTDQITLRMMEPLTEQGTLRLIGNDGRMFLQQTLGTGEDQYQIGLPNIPAGFYLIEVQSGQEKFIQKMIRL